MNRPFLRELAKRAGYGVHSKRGHGGEAWDWGPKHTMLASSFRTEELAWMSLEAHMHRELDKAEKLIRLAADMVREDQCPTS